MHIYALVRRYCSPIYRCPFMNLHYLSAGDRLLRCGIYRCDVSHLYIRRVASLYPVRRIYSFCKRVIIETAKVHISSFFRVVYISVPALYSVRCRFPFLFFCPSLPFRRNKRLSLCGKSNMSICKSDAGWQGKYPRRIVKVSSLSLPCHPVFWP